MKIKEALANFDCPLVCPLVCLVFVLYLSTRALEETTRKKAHKANASHFNCTPASNLIVSRFTYTPPHET